MGIGRFDSLELQMITGEENIIDVNGFSELGSVTKLVQEKIASRSKKSDGDDSSSGNYIQ